MTSKQYGFYFESGNCVECHACEVACKAAHDVDFGVRWRRVVSVWGGTFPNITNTSVSLSCMHCGNAPCAAVCPTGAIQKRAEDGIVVVDREKCIGCHYCFFACPFGVPQYGDDGTMQKCDMCLDRLAEGKEPACVETCPAECLHFGTLEDLAELAREHSASNLAGSNHPAMTTGQ